MIKKSNLFILIILILVLSKQIRFIPSLQFLWNFSYYLSGLIIIYGFIYFLSTRRYNSFDLIVIVFNIYLLIPALLSSDKLLFISIYILPFSGFYLIRSNFGNKINFYQLMLYLSFFIPLFTLIEFIPENFLNYKIINYENVPTDVYQEGSIYGGNRYDKKVHPLILLFAPEFSLVERPLGVSMSPQTTGAVIAGFGLYLISYSNLNYKKYYFRLLIVILGLLSTLSGTGILIFLLGLPIILNIKNRWIILPFLIPIMAVIAILIRGYEGFIGFIGKYILYLGKYMLYQVNNYFDNPVILFGGNQSITMDIDYANYLFRFGLFGVILFCSIVLIFFKYCKRLYKIDKNFKALFIFANVILIANFHYSSVFRFPGSFILFMIFGFVSKNNFRLSNIIHTKDNNFIPKSRISLPS